MMKDSVINPVPVQTLGGLVKARVARPEGGRVDPPVSPQGGKELPQPRAPELPQQDLSKVVESINDYLQTVKRDLQFSVDASSGRTVITVLDRESKEVIRQIPPEAAVELAANLRSDGGFESLALAEKA